MILVTRRTRIRPHFQGLSPFVSLFGPFGACGVVPAHDLEEPLSKVKTKQGQIVLDPLTNSIIGVDIPDAIAAMRQILETLDVRPETAIARPKAGELVTIVFRLAHIPKEDIMEPLTEAKSDQGTVTFVPDSNAVIVTDTLESILRMHNMVEKLDVQPETRVAHPETPIARPKPGESATVGKLFGPISVPFDVAKNPLESAKTSRGKLFFIEESKQIAVFDTADAIAEMEKILAQLEQEPGARPTPTPRPLAQNYRIRNILGGSAILLDYRMQQVMVRKGSRVDDPLGPFTVEEVDPINRRVRVKLISNGHERWIDMWEGQQPTSRRRNL